MKESTIKESTIKESTIKESTIKESIIKLVAKKDLNPDEMTKAIKEIMEGKASKPQIAAFLVALRMKGETYLEITAAAQVMKNKATKIQLPNTTYSIDIVGTGGDASGTFNISTAAAFVLAAGGLTVAKHGNRNISSLSGSADVLEELGVNINASKENVELCIKKTNIGFLFAPILHNAMKYVAPVRKELAIRTIFNCLGPLTNPANPEHYLIGVYDKTILKSLGKAIKTLGVKKAMLVRGEDGLDEITTTTKTKVFEINNGQMTDYYINPKDFNIPFANSEELKGKTAKDNAQIIKDIFNGKKDAKRNIVALNAGAAFYIANLDKSIKDGINRAYSIIDSAKALDTLNSLVRVSNMKQ